MDDRDGTPAVPEIPGDRTPARGPAARKALAEYVLGTAEAGEPDWLEWKTGYDLTTAAGRASTAKHLLGFANRMPDVAARHAGGLAYLLLGVEPGCVSGMPGHDRADIENWLRPYVGPDLVFDVDTVSLGGERVLFFTVDPPRQGDPIFPLRKEGPDEAGKSMRNGTIFVRRPGKTEVADSGDVDRLGARARLAGAVLAVEVAASRAQTLPGSANDNILRGEFIAQEASRLEVPPVAAAEGALQLGSRHITSLGGPDRRLEDSRGLKGYERAVREYLEEVERRWRDIIAAGTVDSGRLPLVAFDVINPSDRNYAHVRLEIDLPLHRACVHGSVERAIEFLDPPRPPRAWGEVSRLGRIDVPSVMGKIEHPLDPEIRESGSSTEVRFFAMNLRPFATERVGELVLLLGSDRAGECLDVGWQATSTSTNGRAAGSVQIRVEPFG
ncbi:MAG: hypothetical protein U0R70_08860 [Solirubrobacteraceae bacterium]